MRKAKGDTNVAADHRTDIRSAFHCSRAAQHFAGRDGTNHSGAGDSAMCAQHRGTRVLLAQGPSDDVEMYVEFFSPQGIATIVATADAALASAGDADIIITDIALGGDKSSTNLVTRLHEDWRTRSIPVIAPTARVFDPNRRREEGAGYDLFLFKPCLPNELLRHVRGLLSRIE